MAPFDIAGKLVTMRPALGTMPQACVPKQGVRRAKKIWVTSGYSVNQLGGEVICAETSSPLRTHQRWSNR
jgi:hypothetical protein